MTTRELRRKYLDFFVAKGHSEYPSGSLIPTDVTGRLDESLLFNGAGMIQFKPYFRGVAEPENKRLTSAQKCVRTGDIEIVGDSSHLTFFEMMGNFSFGDYFQKEAIAFSWEFLTSKEWLGLDPNLLSFTVYSEDNQAYDLWSEHLIAAGIDPSTRIFKLGEETNYWPAGAFSSGPPGPCGPNSEMFFWTDPTCPPPSGPYSAQDYIQDEAEGKWLEIWNDVFIQYEWQGELVDSFQPNLGFAKTGMPNLPFRSVDTGMGLERTAAVLGGFQSVYDTDAFTAIIKRIIEIGGGRFDYGNDEKIDHAIRIISDHIRTACFCIADGILPANNGRGYVLRRLIRRAVLKGQRSLSIDEPFFYKIYAGVAETMGDHYTQLIERHEVITQTLRNEEHLFRKTLLQGTELLTNWLTILKDRNESVLQGHDAFKLYDTFGFPLEVTIELCQENGIVVDQAGYDTALLSAQRLSQGATGMETVYGGVKVEFNSDGALTSTEFLGYNQVSSTGQIIGAFPEFDEQNVATGNFGIALDQTPFYAESGGQMSDIGTITGPGFKLEVIEMTKLHGVFVHLVRPISTVKHLDFENSTNAELASAILEQFFNQVVTLEVCKARRERIKRNHTATHLLHAALRNTLGKHVSQAGSQVGPDSLRFDFTHGKALTSEELRTVEDWVNAQILSGHGIITHVNVPIAQAKAMGAMALFGEKYGDSVRVVDVRSDELEPISIELCGGIHVNNTGQIGMFKILHESSAASGVRRIEAITGETARIWAMNQHEIVLSAASLMKTQPTELLRTIEKHLDSHKEDRKKLQQLALQGATADAKAELIGSVNLTVKRLTDTSIESAQAIADRIVENKLDQIAVVVLENDGKVMFICKIAKGAVAKGAHAGNIVKDLAMRTGGAGGGRPDFATAGSKDSSKLEDALQHLRELINQMVK